MDLNDQKPARSRPAIFLGAAALLVLHIFLSFFSADQHSVTIDETAHLPAGISYWQTSDFSIYRHNPPLIRMWAALPAVLFGTELKPENDLSEYRRWGLAYAFQESLGHGYHDAFRPARGMILLLSVCCGLCIFLYARKRFGNLPALLALGMFALDPNILAHSHLVTTDIGCMLFIFLAFWAFENYLPKRSSGWLIITGVLLGLAQLTKFSALLLYPLFLSFMAYDTLRAENIDKPDRALPRMFLRFAAICLMSMVVINAGYLGQETMKSLRDYEFASSLMNGVKQVLPGAFPVPLPEDYVMGFDEQKEETQGSHVCYFMGQVHRQMPRHYYLVALLIKEPLIIVGLVLLGLWLVLRKGSSLSARTKLLLTIPPLFFLVLFSLTTNIGIGVRYLLPIFPFLYLIAAAGLSTLAARPQRVILGISLLLLLAVQAVYPNYLSFFSISVGGPSNGHEYLGSSNLDWGQNLPALKEEMDKRDLDEINLFYWGRVDPELYGIKYQVKDPRLYDGVSVISVNFLNGLPYWVYDHERLWELQPYHITEIMDGREPDAIIHHTLYWFEKNPGAK